MPQPIKAPATVHVWLAEAIVALTIVFCLVFSVLLQANGSSHISWADFVFAYLSALGLIILGFAYRLTKRSERLAATLVTAGLYVAFTNAGAKLNYLLFPTHKDTIDVFLIQVDAYMYFDWESFVSWFEGREMLSGLLFVIYQTSLIQLLIVILFLGLTGRVQWLHEFILVGVTSSLLCILIWSIIPSFGPAYIIGLPLSLIESLRLAVDAGYIAHLKDVAGGHITEIKPSLMRGLIAFPSMHTVMLLMVVVFTLKTRALPFFLMINAPMIPAILLHGGHHLSDVLGGIAIFFIALRLARSVLKTYRPTAAF